MPKPASGRDFYIATADEIRAGRTTDIYFVRTLDVLKKAGRDRTNVVAEMTTGGLPDGWPWGIFCGLEEVVHLLQDRAVSVWAIPEGSVFPAKTPRGIPVPVMICQASGIATKAARIRKAAGGKQVLSFGVRRMHPGIAPLIERSVYVGGLDAITTPLGAELLGAPAVGTMPHALVIVMGGPREAFAAVHKYLEAKIPRIALVDTYYDEKTEALMAVEAIPDLAGVRLDTPASRRGDGTPAAKRGKFGGRKDLQRCTKDGTYEIAAKTCPGCGSKMAPAYVRYLDRGRATAPLPTLAEIRERTLHETQRVPLGS